MTSLSFILSTVEAYFASTTYRKRGGKAITIFLKNEFLRKQQSCAVPRQGTGGEIEDLSAVRTEHGEHGVCRLLLLRLLGVAVGALQKAGVRMAHEVCHRLLVYAAVQKRGHEVVPQGVKMVLPRKADGVIDIPQPLGEGVRVNELTVFIGEEVGTEPAALLVRLHLPAALVGEEDTSQVRGEVDFTALAVFGRALHNTLAGNAAAGTADGEQQTVLRAGEVRPLQSAQLAPAAAGVHGEQIKQTVSFVGVAKRTQVERDGHNMGGTPHAVHALDKCRMSKD